MARKPFIGGNWKMNIGREESKKLAKQLKKVVRAKDSDVVVFPSHTSLYSVSKQLKRSKIAVGAQNCYHEQKGAFTGEVSIGMLREAGCSHILIGHSERRKIFGEDNALLNKKLLAVLSTDLVPVLCIGETEPERDGHHTKEVTRFQLEGALKGVDDKAAPRMVVAYEPVWAIGTGKTATPEQAEDAHNYIRHVLESLYGGTVAKKIRIIYGGSVNSANAASLKQKPEIDGFLVGGASLDAEEFSKIVARCSG